MGGQQITYFDSKSAKRANVFVLFTNSDGKKYIRIIYCYLYIMLRSYDLQDTVDWISRIIALIPQVKSK